ncbi:sortase-like acyltransferase [Terriglobus roseus DSM 18391]|uniref:Sortase-like acyltransferase n=1 Tax=Terriglobus roseus (strain DSM 18391 / NRRL B-41598 / KBS 63) TaxID=926566 RepID=I3ZCV3_TERRK|nr:GNAT family N-acetyltransferase [Terriglobus roseus]AFL87071.1 sortase-like acyltransferase [Terriglobus roseus DSM 18391]
MVIIRRSTMDDVALIAAQRHSMFLDNEFATADELDTMNVAFEPWLRERLADGRYLGLFAEEDGVVLAGAGILFNDFPPHYLHVEAGRPYLLNFYTEPVARGRGLAKELLKACVEECRVRGCKVVTLHASKFGRPIYEKFGFEQTNEMMIKL